MIKTTRAREITFLGRRVKQWEVRLAGPTGFRRIFIHHIDVAHPRNGGHAAGTIRTKLVLGDGRDPNAKIYEDRVITEKELHATDWHADLDTAAEVLFERTEGS